MKLDLKISVIICLLLAVTLLGGSAPGVYAQAAATTQVDIYGPVGSGKFGATISVLPNGNIIVIDQEYDFDGAVDAGAVHLYNGASGDLISSMTGTSAGDHVGSGGVTILENGNYVVSSPDWDKGGVTDAGAVTWGNAATGVSGVVSSANSLVGSKTGDMVGNGGVTALPNGNYVVCSPRWDNTIIWDAVGAVTWGNGTTGITGEVSKYNSLVGNDNGYAVRGWEVVALRNGNYVTSLPGSSVTWGNGMRGAIGSVTEDNSLLARLNSDDVGSGGVVALSDGNYVVVSPRWNNGYIRDVGAITWVDGTRGMVGAVTPENSLVGPSESNSIGWVSIELNGVVEVANGNYVVVSPFWSNGTIITVGAVTWVKGGSPVSGVVSPENSLVGSFPSDYVGSGGIAVLANGNYVVISKEWDNSQVKNAGAVTWGNGNGGTIGAIATANSLVGGTPGDMIGSQGVLPLGNGNYVVLSPYWDNSNAPDAGAVTWGNGNVGTIGVVSAANSLVSDITSLMLGLQKVAVLANGNYVVPSSLWDNGRAINVGAVTWGNGATGIAGLVSTATSLYGVRDGDMVGNDVTALENGNYVVRSTYWDNGSDEDAGAITWAPGVTGLRGQVSTANSLVGDGTGGHIGISGVYALSNGNYLVSSDHWRNGSVPEAGAVTWMDGSRPAKGGVTVANSLVGSSISDQVGGWGIFPLRNGSYVVRNPWWDNGLTVNVGAITWGHGAWGVTGPVSPANSVIGGVAGGGLDLVYGFDDYNHQLVVGRPHENIISLFRVNMGLTVKPALFAQRKPPGSTVDYAIEVMNTSAVDQAFNLAVSGNQWPTTIPAATGLLAPGAKEIVNASVSIPVAASHGSTDFATIKVSSQSDPAIVDSVNLTTTAVSNYGVAVKPFSSAQVSRQGRTVEYSLTIENTGVVEEVFNVKVSGNLWTTGVPATVGPIAPGQNRDIKLQVSIPPSAVDFSTDKAVITVTSQKDPSQSDKAIVTTTADGVNVNLRLDMTVSNRAIVVGDVITYTFVVTNDGPNDATGVVLTDNLPWWSTTYLASDSRCSEPAPSVICNLGNLAMGESKVVWVSINLLKAGSVVNDAIVTVDQPDPYPEDNAQNMALRVDNYRIFHPFIIQGR